MNYLDRITSSKTAHSNCKGTALYLAGILEEDIPIDWRYAHEKLTLSHFLRARDLEKLTSPEDGCIALFTPTINSNGQEAGIFHAGIITTQKNLAKQFGLSSFIYRGLKEMLRLTPSQKKWYYKEDQFYQELVKRREKITQLLKQYQPIPNFDLKNTTMIHRAGANGILCLDDLEFMYNVSGDSYRYTSAKEKPVTFFKKRESNGSEKETTIKEILEMEGFLNDRD